MAQADFSRISTNIAALNTLNSLRSINSKLGTSQLRLATGRRINQASDDPAGLTIALKMRGRNEGLKAALGNISDAKNMLAIGEGGLNQISDILTEMKAKATAAATETLGTDERRAIKIQLQSLAQQIDDVVSETSWNGEKLLGQFTGGTLNMSKTLQTGAGVTDTTTWSVDTDHRATQVNGLNLATNATTAGTDVNGTVNSSFDTSSEATGVTLSSASWLPELSSGDYEFEVLMAGASSTAGAAAATSGDWGTSVIGTTVAPAEELANGSYRLHIDTQVGGTGGTATYTVYDVATGDEVFTQNTAVDFGTVQSLKNGTDAIGVSITDTGDANIFAGADLFFDYVEQGQAKVQLSEGGTVKAVDADGSDTTNVVANAFYVDTSAGAASYDTGFGITVNLASNAGAGALVAGHKSQFTYTEAGTSIALNSADSARTFMGKVDSALTIVTNSLNDVGSLVARLDAKEVAVGVAQVNTEAAYNRVMNADMAYEQVQASKYQILQQTAMAMLSQANMAPQGILSLFR